MPVRTPGYKKTVGTVTFPLQLAFNGPNPEVGMQRFEVGDKDDGVAVSLQGLQHCFKACLQGAAGQRIGERAIRLLPRQRRVAIGGEPDLA